LPVMVFFYGGGFSFGTGEMYPVYGFAVQGDVIAVNINYRVSSLGWLSTGINISEDQFPCQALHKRK
jgi:carboxylesterase type B